MPDRSVTLLVVLFLVFGATAPAGALAVADTGEPAADVAVAQPENDTTNETATFGASVSAFVQTSAADAEGEVDDGVFSARFENASNETRERLVRDRTDRLADRIDRLREQRAALLNTTGDLTVAERARAARLAARIDSLETTLDVTEDAARTAGVNGTQLATLREQATELGGPEVAEMARGLAGGPDRERPDRGNGPPVNVPGNRTDGPGEGPSEEAPGNRTSGDGQGNGPPDGERGNGDGSGSGQGNGSDGENRGEGNDRGRNDGEDG